MTTFRKNVLVLLGGQISRILVQAAYFILLARILGVTSYGAFTAAVAVAALTSPFSALGSNILMVKNVARSHDSAASHFFRAVFFTVCGGIVLTCLLVAIGHYLVPEEISRWALAAIVSADLIGLKLIELTGYMWQALGSSKPLAVLPTLMNLLRLAAVLLISLISGDVSVNTWSVAYMLATLPLGLSVAGFTMWRQEKISPSFKMNGKQIKEGLVFAVGLASQNSYNDLDKAMLGKLISSASAGVYSAAYRVIDMAYTPVRSVAAAAYPLFFKEGEQGLRSALKLTRRIAPFVIILALMGAGSVWILAPYSPLLLGKDYEQAVDIIRMLAPLIAIRSLSFMAADTLTGSGFQGFRTTAQISIALTNAGLNLLLIPRLGIEGAIISSLACETALALALWCRIGIALRVTTVKKVSVQ